MIRPIHRRLLATPLIVGLTAALFVGCGSDPASTTRFSGPAGAGEQLAKSSGCAGCHGADFQGTATGPRLTGIAGSTVTLDDGSTVIADETYLRQSITDPQSQQVAGFAIKMPKNQMSATQVDELVAFLMALR